VRYLLFFMILCSCSDPLEEAPGGRFVAENPDVASNSINLERSMFGCPEELPKYPGGHFELYRYIALNLPASANKACFEGRIFVAFIVDVDGSIDGVEVLRGSEMLSDEEASKLFEGMPAWVPGKLAGQAVRTKMVVPIHICYR
jgi:hypothetical protein